MGWITGIYFKIQTISDIKNLKSNTSYKNPFGCNFVKLLVVYFALIIMTMIGVKND